MVRSFVWSDPFKSITEGRHVLFTLAETVFSTEKEKKRSVIEYNFVVKSKRQTCYHYLDDEITGASSLHFSDFTQNVNVTCFLQTLTPNQDFFCISSDCLIYISVETEFPTTNWLFIMFFFTRKDLNRKKGPLV